MLETYLASEIISAVRACTDQDTGPVTDAQMLPFIDAEVAILRREVADVAPDLYTAVSADLTLASGNTLSLAAITDLSKVRVLERKSGDDYYPVALSSFLTSSPGWRQRGMTAIDIYPVSSAPGTYRVKYLTKPTKVAATNTPIEIPSGAQLVIAHRVAAGLVRSRFEESQNPHLMEARRLWDALRASIMRMYPTTPVQIVDVRGW